MFTVKIHTPSGNSRDVPGILRRLADDLDTFAGQLPYNLLNVYNLLDINGNYVGVATRESDDGASTIEGW